MEQSDPQRRRGRLWVNPHSDELLSVPEDCADPTQRDYFADDLVAALRAWGKLNATPAAFAEAVALVDAMAITGGSHVFNVYVTQSGQQVVVTFEDRPRIAGAFINFGFVDHVFDLPGSVSAPHGTYARNYLSTWAESTTQDPKPPPVDTAKCDCSPGISHPIGSECPFCGKTITL